MRSLDIRRGGRHSFAYVSRRKIDDGQFKGLTILTLEKEDGEFIVVAVIAALNGILEAIDMRLGAGKRVAVAIEVHPTLVAPKSPARMSWAVSAYPEGQAPPVWSWARFHGSKEDVT